MFSTNLTWILPAYINDFIIPSLEITNRPGLHSASNEMVVVSLNHSKFSESAFAVLIHLSGMHLRSMFVIHRHCPFSMNERLKTYLFQNTYS